MYNGDVFMDGSAKEALEILEWIRKNGGVEVFKNYEMAYSYIKENGFVSPLFLSQIKTKKQEIKSRLGKNE